MTTGRPPTWTDPEAFDKAVDQYFETEKTPTWTGLALHLGFVARESLNYYMRAKPEFVNSVKRALSKIETLYEQRMIGAKNAAGPIFALKNFGWKDTKEIDHTITADRKGIADLFSVDAQPGDTEPKP